MAKFIVILLVALLFEAVGVVFLSGGLKEIGSPKQINAREIAHLVKRGATNSKILIGVALEAIFFGALIYMLSQKDVSLIWPLTSLGFVITTLAAKLYLKEEVSELRWAGVCLIVAGAALITWSEKLKEMRQAASPPAVSTDAGLR